jgi:hypothetical protein
MEALRAVGFYETALRRAGEDQVMAARLRAAGYTLYQAPHLRYFLSVSSDQDSLAKLVRHARLFGRVYPYILLKTPGTFDGIAATGAGRNRRRRAALRALQIGTGGATVGAVLSRRGHRAAWVAGLAGLTLARGALFQPYVRHLKMKGRDITALAALQPPLDAALYVGLAEGLTALLRKTGEPI